MLPPELLDLVTKGGAVLSPLLLYLWWSERTDRKEAQGKLEAGTREIITAMVETKSAIQAFTSMLPTRHSTGP